MRGVIGTCTLLAELARLCGRLAQHEKRHQHTCVYLRPANTSSMVTTAASSPCSPYTSVFLCECLCVCERERVRGGGLECSALSHRTIGVMQANTQTKLEYMEHARLLPF